MSKMKLTHLYLLLFPNGLLKVGKADDIHRRLDDFRRFWGEPDLAQSYYLAADEKLVFRLERSLHCLLDVHSAGIETGDGKTAVFRSDALAPALQHLDVFLSAHPAGTLRR